MNSKALRASSLLFVAAATALAACSPGANAPTRPPLAEKWMVRAKAAYKSGDFEDAKASTEETLRLLPHDEEARVLAGRVALAKLDFAFALKVTEGIPTSEAAGVRGRAHWYAGEIEQAADELEAMLQDPAVKDPWARDIARLARKGTGKHPFAMEGGVVAPVDMPPAGSALIVPLELEGERVLAMVATGSAEVVIDSASGREPSWVNLRFGDRIEVRDVPALAQDLSNISRQVNAPIKALLGVNLLRHIHATFDRRGGQFIVRLTDPPSPPEASRIPLYYVRGGGMLMPGQLATGEAGKGMFFVDTTQPFYVALDELGFKRAGIDPKTLVAAAGMANAKAARLNTFRMGGIDLPGVPALSLGPLTDITPGFDMDLGGIYGAALLEAFRVTFADQGRFAWLEPDPAVLPEPPPPNAPPDAPPAATTPPPAPTYTPGSVRPGASTPPPPAPLTGKPK